MNINTGFYKNNLNKSVKSYLQREKEIIESKPKKPNFVLNPSNLPPDYTLNLPYNNSYEDSFWNVNNKYKKIPHIDFLPKYYPGYYDIKETGYGSLNSTTFKNNLKFL